jgi:hypothetical protein
MTTTIAKRDLIPWGDRQKKGELRMFGITWLDDGYKVDYEILPERLLTSPLETEGSGTAEVAPVAPASTFDRCEKSAHRIKTATADTSFGGAAVVPVAVVQSQDNVPAGKTLSGDSGEKPDSNPMFPACKVRHKPESECDMTGFAKRFEAIAANARINKKNYAHKTWIEKTASAL